MNSTHFLVQFRQLNKLYECMLKEICRRHKLTLIETTIISFLYNNPGRDTAADIVELRMLSKGNVSQAVELLIQKSLLKRIPDENDRRRIHLELLPDAIPITNEIDTIKETFRTELFHGFSKEEETAGIFEPEVMENAKMHSKCSNRTQIQIICKGRMRNEREQEFFRNRTYR